MLFSKFSTAPGNVDLLATSGFYTEVGFFHACIGAATNGFVDTVLGLITQTLISALEALTNFSPYPLLEAAEKKTWHFSSQVALFPRWCCSLHWSPQAPMAPIQWIQAAVL